MIDHHKFTLFEKWVSENTGKLFSLEKLNKVNIYFDSENRKRRLDKAPYINKEDFINYCKLYINIYRSTNSNKPQMEFSPDYRFIKIYKNGENFFNYSFKLI